MKTITTYKLGDLSNGDFATYETEAEAMQNLKEAIDDGARENMQYIGDEGCQWKTNEEAINAAEKFFYVKKHTQEIDEDGDVEWEDYEIIAGRIQ